MTEKRNIAPILMAEDDADDRLFTGMALKENSVANPLVTVNNGEELLEYLYQKGKFSDPATSPQPCFILLDLNMPKLDGREALKIIKDDEKLKGIPVVVMTTSKAEEDIFASYDEGREFLYYQTDYFYRARESHQSPQGLLAGSSAITLRRRT